MLNWAIIGILIAASAVFVVLMYPYDVAPISQSYKQPSEKHITVGAIGSNPTKLIHRFQPTADYLAKKLSDDQVTYAGKVVVAKSIEDMITLLKEKQVDLFYDSPMPALLISEKTNSVPFLNRWKNNVESYHTVFLTTQQSTIKSLDDFMGKTIIFEDKGSSSAYLLPKAFLIQKGFEFGTQKDTIQSVFSGDEDNSIVWLFAGKGDIAALSNIDYEELDYDIKAKIKIVSKTDNIPRHIVSYRSDLDATTVDNITMILLSMHLDDVGKKILEEFKNTAKYEVLDSNRLEQLKSLLDILEENP